MEFQPRKKHFVSVETMTMNRHSKHTRDFIIRVIIIILVELKGNTNTEQTNIANQSKWELTTPHIYELQLSI